jgi:hypothetical protein
MKKLLVNAITTLNRVAYVFIVCNHYMFTKKPQKYD